MNHWSDSEQIIKRGARVKAVRRRVATAVAGAEGWEATTTAIRSVWERAHSWTRVPRQSLWQSERTLAAKMMQAEKVRMGVKMGGRRSAHREVEG
jgi:hypothetical protein